VRDLMLLLRSKGFLIQLAFFLSLPAVASQPIYLDDDELIATYEGSNNVYQYVTTATSFAEALTISASTTYNGVSGHLVTITSEAENRFIYDAFVRPQYISSTSSIEREQAVAWIALTDAETEGTWKWIAGPEHGQVAVYTNWNGGEPNDCCAVGGEDQAVIHWQDRGQGGGGWYDYNSDKRITSIGGQTFIIEYEDALEPKIELTVTLSDSLTIECSSDTATSWSERAEIQAPPDDPVSLIEWMVNGDSVGYGELVDVSLGLGESELSVTVTTESGNSAIASKTITVEDTSAPSISVQFLDRKGNAVTEIKRKGLHAIGLSIAAEDSCDSNEIATSATAGIRVSDGDSLRVHATQTQMILDGNVLKVAAEAMDGSGNTGSVVAELKIID